MGLGRSNEGFGARGSVPVERLTGLGLHVLRWSQARLDRGSPIMFRSCIRHSPGNSSGP